MLLGGPLKEEGSAPHLDDKNAVVAEGVVVYPPGDTLPHAVCAWTLSHSVYSINFAPKLKALGMYIQKLVLHIDDGAEVPRKALTKFRTFMSA